MVHSAYLRHSEAPRPRETTIVAPVFEHSEINAVPLEYRSLSHSVLHVSALVSPFQCMDFTLFALWIDWQVDGRMDGGLDIVHQT